ncbi:MAG: hemolysin III family protein [Varibaculum sp.]|nr:hemolysin III family protein [Varibaculum sp.]
MTGKPSRAAASATQTQIRQVKRPRLDANGEVKPLMRGWIHTGTVPLALAAAIVLTALAPSVETKWASAIFMACSLLLFGVSAMYHRFSWRERAFRFMRRWDHSNIYLLIAGTYTPISVGLLDGKERTTILWIVWSGAILGVLITHLWIKAPRWLTSLIYIILGWTAAWYLPALYHGGGAVPLVMMICGGAAYTVGGVIYALKKPNPSPKYFGFHEIFHSCTVVGWTCLCIAAYFAVLG